MIVTVVVNYRGEDLVLGNIDILAFKEEIAGIKEYISVLMQRGADLNRENKCDVDSLIFDLFSNDCDMKEADKYVKDNYSLIVDHFEWERLGWISEFIDLAESFDGKFPPGFYMIYGSVRGILPRDFPATLRYSTILCKTWNILRNELRDGIISSWLDNNWDEAQQYLSKMRFPPTFEQDYYVGATYRELFKIYSKRLDKGDGEKRRGETEREYKQDA